MEEVHLKDSFESEILADSILSASVVIPVESAGEGEPEWKKKIWSEYRAVNKNSEVLQKFFSQAENTIGISINTLKGDIRKGQERIITLETEVFEKQSAIEALQQEVESLKARLPKDINE